MAKLTKAETTMLAHIREHGTARGITLGRGRPNDCRVILSLEKKLAIVGHRWESEKPAYQRYWQVFSQEDKNGFRFAESYVAHHKRIVRGEDWDAIPDGEGKWESSQNGSDTARECGYLEHPDFETISMAFAISTYELLYSPNR